MSLSGLRAIHAARSAGTSVGRHRLWIAHSCAACGWSCSFPLQPHLTLMVTPSRSMGGPRWGQAGSE